MTSAECSVGSESALQKRDEATFSQPWGKGGRSLSYVATVQGNGNLLVGKAYTAMLDLQPGDEFEIKLGRKQIKLIPLGSSEEE